MQSTTINQKNIKVLAILVVVMLISLACSLPFNIPGEAVPEEWQPQEEPFHEEEPFKEEPHPEDPDMMEEPHPEEHMPEDPPPGNEPPPEPQPQQPAPQQPAPQQPAPQQPQSGGQNQPFSADLAVTDIYPGKQPQGMFQARITNHGPGTLNKVTVPVICQYERTDKNNGSMSQQTANLNVTLNLAPGKTQNFPTTLTLDTTVFSYLVACEVMPNFNDPNPGNNVYNEMLK